MFTAFVESNLLQADVNMPLICLITHASWSPRDYPVEYSDFLEMRVLRPYAAPLLGLELLADFRPEPV